MLAAALWALAGGVAGAHVHADLDPPQAGATGAHLDLEAAAESDTAGISRLEVQADPPFPAGAVGSLVFGPDGWAVRQTPSGGFVAEGAPLPQGRTAELRVAINRVPDGSRLVLKVLQTYADGRVDRWIEVPTAGGAEPDSPAVVIELQSAAGPPTASPEPDPDDSPAATPGEPTGPPSADDPAASDFPWIPAVLALVVLPLGLLVFGMARRRTPPKGPGSRGPGGATPV